MTNTVEGVVTFRTPIFLRVQAKGQGGTALKQVAAVRGKWTSNSTGTDGKITVSAIVEVNNDNFVELASSLLVETVIAATGAIAPNVVSVTP